MSVGRSLKATFDFLVGNPRWRDLRWCRGRACSIRTKSRCYAVVAMTIAPLTLLPARNPSFSVAPVTAVIVLFVPPLPTPVRLLALDRILQVALGGVTGFAVSFLLPSTLTPSRRGSRRARSIRWRAFWRAACGFHAAPHGRSNSVTRIQDRIGQAFGAHECHRR